MARNEQTSLNFIKEMAGKFWGKKDKDRVTTTKKRQREEVSTSTVEAEQELPQDYAFISAERQRLYEAIYDQIEEEIPGGQAEVILTAAMGSSIKDILLTVPIADGATIVVYDDGNFESAHSIPDDMDVDEIRNSYFKSSASKGRTNFARSLMFSSYDQNGFGNKDLLMWELEELGVDTENITIEQVGDSDTWMMQFTYDGKGVTLYFVQGRTSDFDEEASPANKIIKEKGIDAVVAKASDGAYGPEQFSSFIKDNVNKGGVLLTDQWMILDDVPRYRIYSSDAVKDASRKGRVDFGYPTGGAAFTMPDSVSVHLYRFRKDDE